MEVIGDFNDWDGKAHQLNVRWDNSGIWEGFLPKLAHGFILRMEKKKVIFMMMIKMVMVTKVENITTVNFLSQDLKIN